MIHIVAAYCFVPLADPSQVRADIVALCTQMEVRGTLILAHEGFNGTLAGSEAAIAQVTAALRGLAGDARPEIKNATAPAMPFGRLKVKVKPEIVTMGAPGLDFVNGSGTHVAPRNWNALIADPATLLVDTRNAYEVAIGSFDGAVDPGTRSFAEFPGWLAQLAAAIPPAERAARPLAMFCTGGIRCEKSTALARSLGFGKVFHLKGGILAYLEQVEASESRWQGDCFVFDERVAVGHGLDPGQHALCQACGLPVATDAMDDHAAQCSATPPSLDSAP